ncbi:VanW family protein [Qaidamihabitans albus]|uniref:VanW family protein n=1 Tax=Qaidamihabitans albus TaxID=2795733 RepID=UPI0018F1231B|nr:VanW family protein [Qaidamihabitans albus]
MSDSDADLVDELFDGPSPAGTPAPPSRFRRMLGRVFLLTGGALALFVVLYAADLMSSAGDVPRGVAVAGVDVGGLSRAAAEARLHEELEPRLTEPVTVRAGDVEAELDPAESGLGVDWPGTLELAGSQPLDPLVRIRSFFTTREVDVRTTTDDRALRAAVTELARDRIDRAVIEGDIRFEATEGGDGLVDAFAVEPRQGQRLADVDGAVAAIEDGWPERHRVEVPVEVTPPEVTSAEVHATLDDTVRPLVSGPLRVRGDDAEAVLRPGQISGALDFTAVDGGLEVEIDRFRLQQAVRGPLTSTEEPARDARIVFAGSAPAVRPAEQGRRIDWERTFAPLLDVGTRAENRELDVVYEMREPEVTTAEVEGLGIKEVIGEFTTSGMSGAVARNVATIARAVNGAIVTPGETFSLDERTGPRTASQGYVVAPVNEDGTGRRVIGGGVSQFTSTLYNAVYLAGLADAGHTEHPYHLGRYPVARDAISLRPDGSRVDLAFTNDAPTGIAIQTSATGSTVRVKIWGTERYRVESVTDGPDDMERPPIEWERGEDCRPVDGVPGFRATNTRILSDPDSGEEVGRQTREVRYAPRPTVRCRSVLIGG